MSVDPSWAQEEQEYQPELTDAEIYQRRRFVAEYLKDHDGTAAAMRVGYMRSFAKVMADRFLSEPYVQRLISDNLNAQTEESRAKLKEQDVGEHLDPKDQVLAALLREALYKGPGSSHAARVSALKQLSSIYGLDAPTKTEVVHRGGVMAVPMYSSPEEWEKAATEAQSKLMQDAES